MKRKIALIGLLACAMINLATTLGQNKPETEWKYSYSYNHRGNEVKLFYDPQSIKRLSGGIVQVWIKQIERYQNDEAKRMVQAELIENRRLSGFPLIGYEKYAYSKTMLEFDCAKRMVREPCIKDYDETDKLIGEQCIDRVPFETVPKEHPILNVACNHK